MARELVLLPKAKYDKLMSDETERKTKEMSIQTKNEPEKKSDVNEEKVIQDNSTNLLNNVTNSEQKDTGKILKRGMLSRRAQRGGKWFIRTTPSDFMKSIPKKHTIRKWLSFKI